MYSLLPPYLPGLVEVVLGPPEEPPSLGVGSDLPTPSSPLLSLSLVDYESRSRVVIRRTPEKKKTLSE